jgi:hypothetical protein
LPHIPLVQDPPTSLEASLPAPPRRPHNVARKRVAKIEGHGDHVPGGKPS